MYAFILVFKKELHSEETEHCREAAAFSSGSPVVSSFWNAAKVRACLFSY